MLSYRIVASLRTSNILIERQLHLKDDRYTTVDRFTTHDLSTTPKNCRPWMHTALAALSQPSAEVTIVVLATPQPGQNIFERLKEAEDRLLVAEAAAQGIKTAYESACMPDRLNIRPPKLGNFMGCAGDQSIESTRHMAEGESWT